MASPAAPAIAPPPRKTLLEWIDIDDGDTTGTTQPACSTEVLALHAAIFVAPDDGRNVDIEALQPPPGLRLPPLG